MYKTRNPDGHVVGLKKSDWILIGCTWLIVQLIFLTFFGINDQEESIKYYTLADQWMKGNYGSHLYPIFYSGYTGIHFVLKIFGLPHQSMYGIQLILSGLSVFYFSRILGLLVSQRITVVITTILYTTSFIIQQWVSILYTDSVFCSLFIMATYFLMTETENKWNQRLCWTLFLLLPFFRPVGFLFVIVACFYWTNISMRQNRIKIVVCMVYVSLIGLLVYQTFVTAHSYFFPIHSLHNILGNILCGYTDNRLAFVKVPYQEGMSVYHFLIQNPEMTVRLFMGRAYKIFSLSRPYFSTWHNRILFLSTTVYYITALIGAFTVVQKKLRKTYFLLAGIGIFALPQILFCVEWSGRFSLPVICYVLILSGMGIDRIIRFSSSSTPAPHDGGRW